jgi:Gluconolactonase
MDKSLMDELKIVTTFKADLGESPLWDSEKKIIYWVDIISKKLFSYNIETDISSIINFNNFLGCIALRKNGEFLAASEEGFYFFNRNTFSYNKLFNPEEEMPKNRFNDGKCDAAGRFWVGSTTYDENKKNGSLYCIDKNLNCKKVLGDITVSNGIAWSLDNKTMYYIDSPTKKVRAYDYDIKNGEIKNERVIIIFNEEEGYPDGMTVDAEDKLWIAHWGGYKVGRWDPSNGKMLGKIDIPVERVSSVTFGGDGLDELFITTAVRGFNEKVQDINNSGNKYDGMLFRIKIKNKGISSYRFAG